MGPGTDGRGSSGSHWRPLQLSAVIGSCWWGFLHTTSMPTINVPNNVKKNSLAAIGITSIFSIVGHWWLLAPLVLNRGKQNITVHSISRVSFPPWGKPSAVADGRGCGAVAHPQSRGRTPSESCRARRRLRTGPQRVGSRAGNGKGTLHEIKPSADGDFRK